MGPSGIRSELDVLLDKVDDPTLRADLRSQIERIQAKRTFGLVFESHLPERVRLPEHPIRRGLRVALRNQPDSPAFEVADGLVFCGTRDQPIRRASLYTAWQRAVRAIGLEELRFHDLRHTGNTLAAATGASTKELMTRLGHASPRAAFIYQHAIEERDKAIAEALSEAIQRERASGGGNCATIGTLARPNGSQFKGMPGLSRE